MHTEGAIVHTVMRKYQSRQQGMALVIGLIFLLITSLMAITAMSGVVMQERMAGNLRNASIAEAGAESALRAGDQLIGACRTSDTVLAREEIDPANVNGDCEDAIALANQFRSLPDWSSTWGGEFIHDYPSELIADGALSSHEGAGMAQRPQFMVENMGVVRCTGCATGGQVGSFGGVDAAGSGSATPPPNVYRITGRSVGSTANVMRVAESSYIGIMGDAEAPTP
jgi:type IV pilus assembly protein PilX